MHPHPVAALSTRCGVGGTTKNRSLHAAPSEPRSADAARWYGACTDKLVSAIWCVTKFASALGIKQQTGKITEADGQAATGRYGCKEREADETPIGDALTHQFVESFHISMGTCRSNTQHKQEGPREAGLSP